MAQELNPEEFHKLCFYNSILHHSQQYIAYGWLNNMWTAEVLFHLDHNFDVVFLIRILWFTVSKAFERSMNKEQVNKPLS